MRRPIVSLLLFLVASIAKAAIIFTPEHPVSTPVYDAGVGTESVFASASDGNDFLVVWGDGPLYASRISATGEVRVPPTLIRSGGATHVSVCWTGSTYLVTWHDGSEQAVMVAVMSRNGKIITPGRVLLPQVRTFSGALASNGRNALLVYAAGFPSAASGILLAADGTVVRANISLPARSSTTDDTIKVSSDGINFAVIWQVSTTMRAMVRAMPTPPPPSTTTTSYEIARVDPFGQPIDYIGAQIATMGVGREFGVAYGDRRYAIATIEQKAEGAPTLRRFTVDAITLQVEQLPDVKASGYSPSMIWNGSDFIAYWMDYDFNRFQLNTVEGNRQPVIAFSGHFLGIGPVVAWNGNKLLAAWTDRSRMPAGSTYGGDLFGAFLDPAGNAASEKFLIGYAPRPQSQAVVATSGADALVVWLEQSHDSGIGNVLAVRMSPDGTVLDPKPLELGGDVPVAVTKPAVVFNGSAYFVVWQAGANVLGRRVERNGQLGNIINLGAGSAPAVASNGSITLVVFARYPQMFAMRIDGNDRVLDIPPLLIAPNHAGYNLSVASNGTDFLVVWTEGSDYSPGPPIAGPTNLLDVFGERVTQSGALDAAPIAIATGPKDQGYGVVATDGRDYLVLYELLSGYQGQLAAKGVLREGMLSGSTAEDDGVIVAQNVRAFSVARETAGYGVVWQTGTYPDSLLQFAHLDAFGARGDAITLLDFDPEYVVPSPSIASNGALEFVAYVRLAEQYDFAQRLFVRLRAAPRTRAMRPGK